MSNIRSFLPANVEYGIRLYIQEPSRFFVTTSSCLPVIKVDSVKIYLKCVLFKEPILNRIERKLLGGPLIYPFAADFVKSYSLENVREKTQTTSRQTDRPTQERTDDLYILIHSQGHLETTINIAIRSPFEICYLFLFKV